MEGYAFDRELITQFDNQRHEIIHGNALGRSLTLFKVSNENLYYIHRTGMYFTGLINFKYGLRIDPHYWEEALQAKSGAIWVFDRPGA